MKLIILFAVVLLTAHALSDHEEWLNFKKNHAKSYKNIMEEKQRYAIFQSSLKKIREHNEKYENEEVAYYLGVTQFADMSPEEFNKILLHQMLQKPYIPGKYADLSNVIAPDSVDWRDRNIITDVKDQGTCGACWAFSTTGCLESHNILVNNATTLLSEQELMDCSKLYENKGCNGGLMVNAFDYIQSKGLSSEESYPYEGVDGSCRRNKDNIIVRINEYKRVEPSEEALKNAIAANGPIAVSMYATEDFKLYKGGIYDNPECLNNTILLNHGVVAVGYGIEKGVNDKHYWIGKNSWGKTWGENGFFKLSRNPSVCGIYIDASYPIVKPN